MGDSYVVDIHPMHLRLMAERLGLVRKLSASHADDLRDLNRYKRALLMIRDRAEQLHSNIYGLSQHGREEMGIEVAQSAALADFAEHLCVEFEGDHTAESREVTPSHAPSQTPANASKVAPEQLAFEG
ncbi:MAG: hypothetical protein EON92_16465 [Burkholderiales bacterium]|nr:MAG: hypothetical protein EON92_16465 [Burkholderiales bacterium]